MNIILDAHGGDHAPLEVIMGAALAVQEYGVEVTLCGNEADIRAAAAKMGIRMDGMSVVAAPLIMPMDADPALILSDYAESSMAAGLRLLAKGGGNALVSGGNTGALAMGGSVTVKRLRGIKRAALAALIPNAKGCHMLIDCGANTECRPEMLQQFGIMGSAYMEKVLKVPTPRVGMVNIGTENSKGLILQIEANGLLRESPINFIGNIEAREIPLGGCDVAVCDGFTGNVLLKLTEGMGKWFSAELRRLLLKSLRTKIAAVFISDGLKQFKETMDYTEYGGAPLLGLRKPVIKAHGSSNANAFKNAIRQAKLMVETDMIGQIGTVLTSIKSEGAHPDDE